MSLRHFVGMTTIMAMIATMLFGCTAQQDPANRTVTETLILEKYLINDLYSKDKVISPDGRHVAYFGANNTLVVDGAVQSRPNGSPAPPPHSLVWSPDSKHLAYTIRRDGKYIVVLDGIEGKPYARYDTYLLPSPANYSGFYYLPVFSPDGQHLAYAAQPEDGYCVVLDGVEGKHHEGAVYPKTITFSPDSQHLAYTTNIWIVLDGKEIAPGSGESQLIFSPDSQRLGYLDYGLTEPPNPMGNIGYDIQYPVFSPDSQHFASWVRRYNLSGGLGYNVHFGNFIVLDGVDHNIADVLGVSSMFGQGFFFTYDSQHLAVFTRDGYLVDGKEVVHFDPPAEVNEHTPVLSADGKRVAYLTYRKDESMSKGMYSIVVDGKQGKEYDIGVWFPVFSPDSQHVAYVVSEYGGKRSFVVVDGIEGRVYDLVSTPVFESPNHLRYNAKKGDSLYLVEETIK
jgi:WD40 repeat protein